MMQVHVSKELGTAAVRVPVWFDRADSLVAAIEQLVNGKFKAAQSQNYRDLTWRITGMTCQKCVRLITEALQGFEEVQQVWLDNIKKDRETQLAS